MKSRLRNIAASENQPAYTALIFVCPGCISGGPDGYEGIHMLAVNSPSHKPSWDWDGNLEKPTLNPSILSHELVVNGVEIRARCHSFLREGVFEFLNDSTHELAGQKVPIPDLPEWAEELS